MRLKHEHPLIGLMYFAGAFTGVFIFRHPAFLAAAFAALCVMSVVWGGRRALVFDGILAAVVLVWTVIYASFHHFGVTPLWTNRIGNQITKEAIVSGAVSGVRAAEIILLIVCLYCVVTSDAVIYLTGLISPRFLLYLSVLFEWVAQVRQMIRGIWTAQKGIRPKESKTGLVARIRHMGAVLSMIVTRAIDQAVRISRAMRARGSLAGRRTAYRIYRVGARDRIALIVLAATFCVTVGGFAAGLADAVYNPVISIRPLELPGLCCCLSYAVFLFFPLLDQLGERRLVQSGH